MKKIPVSLIIDDGGVVDMSFFGQSAYPHELLVPMSFAKRFSDICRKNGVKGKFSVIPMPGGLGRIDQRLNRVPTRVLKSMLNFIRKEIEPIFSITPEILTHDVAYDLANQNYCHVYEDAYFSKLNAQEIADYIGLALEILCNVDLHPTGVTSPWHCGIDNEQNYAEGIGRAFKKVMGRDWSFYFLHSRYKLSTKYWPEPKLMCDTETAGKVVTIPNNTFDAFYATTQPTTRRAARASAKENINMILSPDGRTGMAREHFENGHPIILISHWQRLYSDGSQIGLDGLETLVKRVNKVFGTQVEWKTFEEITQDYI